MKLSWAIPVLLLFLMGLGWGLASSLRTPRHSITLVNTTDSKIGSIILEGPTTIRGLPDLPEGATRDQTLPDTGEGDVRIRYTIHGQRREVVAIESVAAGVEEQVVVELSPTTGEPVPGEPVPGEPVPGEPLPDERAVEDPDRDE